MEEKRTVAEERQLILDAMQNMEVDTEEYRKMLAALDKLTEIQKTESEMEIERAKMEREVNLAEAKAKAEIRIREDEVQTKKKESRRGIWKVILAGLFGVGQIVLISNFEETKMLAGKAWNFVTKPKL